MKRFSCALLRIALCLLCVAAAHAQDNAAAGPRFRLITLDPGHFHASLVQKFMYADVDPIVHVYAPAGDDVAEHLKRIEIFNTRQARPTHWRERVYTGPDYLQKMLAAKAGNVVVISGNNARKTDYILRSINAGMNVLADKPMAMTPADLIELRKAFAAAERSGVLLYDIMTERFEITSVLQRELALDPALFGELERGSLQEPAITKQSVHHFSKIVAGAALRRPQWFFDVRQQGEGIVDVTTHLVDLVQWQAFPEQALSPTDATVLKARRWSTPITRDQFTRVTGAEQFPDALKADVRDGVLNVFSNGEFTWRLRGVHAHVSVRWDFEAPPGAGDMHYSAIRGTKARLIIRQGREQGFKPVLYIENASLNPATHDAAVGDAIVALQAKYPGVGLRREGKAWAVTVPDSFNVGHEAHFAQVMENFLRYLREGRLPAWEAPNMLTKYATIMQAYELSRSL